MTVIMLLFSQIYMQQLITTKELGWLSEQRVIEHGAC